MPLQNKQDKIVSALSEIRNHYDVKKNKKYDSIPPPEWQFLFLSMTHDYWVLADFCIDHLLIQDFDYRRYKDAEIDAPKAVSLWKKWKKEHDLPRKVVSKLITHHYSVAQMVFDEALKQRVFVLGNFVLEKYDGSNIRLRYHELTAAEVYGVLKQEAFQELADFLVEQQVRKAQSLLTYICERKDKKACKQTLEWLMGASGDNFWGMLTPSMQNRLLFDICCRTTLVRLLLFGGDVEDLWVDHNVRKDLNNVLMKMRLGSVILLSGVCYLFFFSESGKTLFNKISTFFYPT